MREITELVYHGWGTPARGHGTDGHGRAHEAHHRLSLYVALGLPPARGREERSALRAARHIEAGPAAEGLHLVDQIIEPRPRMGEVYVRGIDDQKRGR